MSRAGIAFALGALLASTGAAAARGGEWQVPSADARKTASQVTKCMVGAHQAEIIPALDLPFGGPEATGILGPMLPPCFDAVLRPRMPTRANQLRLPHLLLRGLLYEAMYAHTFGGSAPAISFGTASPGRYPAVAAAATPQQAHDYPALMRIGECSVRSAPAEARALILSDVASKDEQRALAAFEPAWYGCVPGGRRVTFNIEMIRASVAEPLYRLTASAGRALEAAE